MKNPLQLTTYNRQPTRGGFSRTPNLELFRFCKNFISGVVKFSRKQFTLVPHGETKKTTPNLACGFSLIELLVAVSIFTVVAMVSISALISVNDANKKAQTIRAIIDNLNFSVENMARNLRVGSNYYCGYSATERPPGDCPNSSNAISFFDHNGNWIVYYLSTDGRNQIRKISGTGTDLPLTPYIDSAPGGLQPLEINHLAFFVSGAASTGDNQQPRVVIVLSGTARYSEKIETKFQIQTSVSQRSLDL